MKLCAMMANKVFSCLYSVFLILGIFSGSLRFSLSVFLSLGVLIIYFWKDLLIICKTLPRDLRSFKLLRQTYRLLREYERKNLTVLDLFKGQVHKHPQKVLFYFEDQLWKFSDLDVYSNKIGNIFLEKGYKKGDVVGLLMGNCIEYIGIWLGLAKIGVVTALINTNLRHQPLIHSINAAKAKAIVYSEEYDSSINEILDKIESVKKFRCGSSQTDGSLNNLNLLMNEASKSPPNFGDKIGYRDKVLYIYTSGTTGMPKAAIIPHHRLLMMSLAVSCIMGVKEDEIIYNPLPLYHVAGGLLGTVGPLSHGFSSVIKKKFSATSFWPDCVKYNCTVAQYIGEMCRYVMLVPPKPTDTQHKVRFVFGNGMRASLWTDFKERFKLERICEIYGSTEGNTNLVNLDKTVGAVGFLPNIVPGSFVPVALIKVDDFGEPIRNSQGLCMRCQSNEPGMLIGMIVDSDATRDFSGYVGDSKETEKKVIRNVFKQGDRAFLTGDILVKDELGYLYFKDRTGDTFKWKGENVSTTEVEGIISSAVHLRDVLVYGVEVGNLEGRAGMATIVDPDSKVDLQSLAKEINKNLPPYARPLFLRFTNHVDLTGTYKLKKLIFQKEGFDPKTVKGKLYFRNASNQYVELTKEIYNEIISGRIKV